jgi:hypothetical protein
LGARGVRGGFPRALARPFPLDQEDEPIGDPRSCRCESLTGTGEISVRRLPTPEVSYEAVCASCGTSYWLSVAEAERLLAPDILAKGKRALEEMEARYASPKAEAERRARARLSFLRPLRDAWVLFLRRLRGGNRAGEKPKGTA